MFPLCRMIWRFIGTCHVRLLYNKSLWSATPAGVDAHGFNVFPLPLCVFNANEFRSRA